MDFSRAREEVTPENTPKGEAGASISERAASFADQTRRQFEAALDRAEASLAPGRQSHSAEGPASSNPPPV